MNQKNGHYNSFSRQLRKKYAVSGLGAALLDRFANVSEGDLAEIGSQKSSMSLVSSAMMEKLSTQAPPHSETAGGAAANTIAGVARLGLRTAFFGKVADDRNGAKFRGDMMRLHIRFPTRPAHNMATGSCLVLVTPDAERTMYTDLGAAPTFMPQDLDEDILAASAIFYVEGYIWDWPQGRECFLRACEYLRKYGGKIAFSLADPLCVQRHHDEFAMILKTHVDILCANIAEAKAMFGTNTRAGLTRALAEYELEAAITRSDAGAWCFSHPANDDKIATIKAIKVAHPTDLTGAGDQFAAGFLAARAHGLSLDTAGHMGAIAASEVIQHFGPQPQSDLRALMTKHGISDFA